MDKKQAFGFLDELQGKGIKLGLSRMKKFMKATGNPERKYVVVHVGGTNGKGSTAAMIESILRHAGYRTGLYTSPHLVNFNERFKVNGKNISDKSLVALVAFVKKKMSKANVPLTYFEFITAMAFQHFANSEVDVAVVEVGLGGRLDATNVVVPTVCAITNVELEHEAVLGKGVSTIAEEKVGIIKRGVPVVTTEKKEQVIRVFRKKCRGAGAKLVIVKEPFAGKLSLKGDFQRANAALALASVKELQKQGFEIEKLAIEKGLISTDWPGRFQVVKKRPLVVLDCAHNPACCDLLVGSFKKEFPKKEVLLVFGVSNNKNALKMAKHLAEITTNVFVTNAKYRAMSLGKLSDCFLKTGCAVEQVPRVENAVKRALACVKKDGVILVTGSCFVVGEALQLLGE